MQAMPSQAGYENGGVDEHQQQSQAPPGGVAAPGDFMLPHTQLELRHPMARTAAYSYSDQYFGGIVAAYGNQAMIHPHMLGVQQARMPLPSEMMEEEPVYVNAKQYHGILRRRQSRAKAESENKLIKARKPYLHESRHLHALRRARGCGGRFLNTKEKEGDSKGDRSSEGQSSEGDHSSHSHGSHAGQNLMITFQGEGSSQAMVSMQQMAQYHQGMLAHGGHLGMGPNSSQGGGYHNNHQGQAYHSSAFHPLPGGPDSIDNGQNEGIISNGSQQASVGTL